MKYLLNEGFNRLFESLKDEPKVLKESDLPAALSIKDCQKWVDYDMEKYGKISDRTNLLVKKAGFQIIKDDHGDYEVAAGKFESLKEESKTLKASDEFIIEDMLDFFDFDDIEDLPSVEEAWKEYKKSFESPYSDSMRSISNKKEDHLKYLLSKARERKIEELKELEDY